MVSTVTNINITATQTLPSPDEMRAALDKTDAERQAIHQTRELIHRIIFGDDKRLLVVAGPCSIHDVDAGLEYARKFKALADKLQDRIVLVMRAYFEKPRTSIGWKGLIMDPHLDGTYDLPEGLRTARRFLLELTRLGLPTATELLDPITPQYIADLICWSCIGARTTESQTHRQMASGLSMPLGFKNGTDGALDTAINAIKAASSEQTFLGIDTQGRASALTTRGNPNCHLVLRGGKHGPNYDTDSVESASEQLSKAGLIPALMVDCSHGNSNKDYRRQPEVLDAVVEHALAGRKAVIGAMLESNLHEGNQPFPKPKDQLQHGVSITDGCIGWDTTEAILLDAYEKLAPRFK